MNSDCLYSPLSGETRNIRLLRILPTEKLEDPVACTLDIDSVGSSTEYYALSYAWGDPSITEEITANNHRLPITTNLISALRHLRNVFPANTKFWIDAVCINQDDVHERNDQVLHMRDVYRNAKVVVSWLGSHPQLVHGMKIWKTLAFAFARHPNDDGWIDDVPELFGEIPDEKSEDDRATEAWDAIMAVFRDGYWRRMWILQERVYATSIIVMCGKELYHMSPYFAVLRSKLDDDRQNAPRLRGFFDRITTLKTELRYTVDVPSQFLLQHLPESAHSPQVTWLYWHLGFRATEPKDMIYANPAIELGEIGPDYLKSDQEVYAQYTRENLSSGALYLLCIAGIGVKNRMPNLPSWAVNWHNNDGAHLEISETLKCSACVPLGSSRWSPLKFDESNGMLITGILWQRVARTYPGTDFEDLQGLFHLVRSKFSAPFDEPTLRSFVSDFIAVLYWLGGEKPQSVDGDEIQTLGMSYLSFAFIYFLEKNPSPTLTQGAERFRNTCRLAEKLTLPPSKGPLQTIIRAAAAEFRAARVNQAKDKAREFLRTAAGGFGKEKSGPAVLESQLIDTIARKGLVNNRNVARIRPKLANTSFFESEGFVGSGPANMEEGDLMCFLQNVPTPMILRMQESYHVLVGPCYVRGMMRGEILKELEAGTVKLKTFKVR